MHVKPKIYKYFFLLILYIKFHIQQINPNCLLQISWSTELIKQIECLQIIFIKSIIPYNKYNIMQSNPIHKQPLPQRISKQISQLSSDSRYIILHFPKTHLWKKLQPVLKDNNPYLLVLEDDQKPTHIELAEQLIKENNFNLKSHCFFFEEMVTNCHFRNMNLSKMKRILQVEVIDGYWFQVIYEEIEYDPETGLLEMTAFDKKIEKKGKQLTIYIQQLNYYFNLAQQSKDNHHAFMTKIINHINKTFKVNVDPNNIKITYFDDDMNEAPVNCNNFSKLVRKDNVILKFIDKININRPIYKNQENSIIFKFNQQQNKLAYAEIRALKIQTIFDRYLGFKQKKLNAIEFGLRIHDLIVKPCQSLSDHPILEKLFLSQSRYVKIVLALVVTQQFMFYAHLQAIADLSGKNEVIFNNLVHKSPQNQKYRAQCIKTIKARAEKAKEPAFKNNQKRIQPILYYTSELLIREDNKQMKLYYAQNLFLRNMQFGIIDRSMYNKWQFLFTRSLLNNLKLIEPYQGDLYRGISHKETHKLNKIMSYKQFNSCSTDINQSLSFTKTTLYILKKCKIGRKIKDYSYFQNEEEILNLPYTSYKIIKIEKKKHNNLEIEVVTMQEVARPTLKFDLKDQKQLFILWVDGQKGQGLKVSKNVNFIEQTTYFVHMRTTKELQEWLIQYKERLKDPTVKTVLITNMFRMENGVPTQNAGALAIKVFTEFNPTGRVMVYIGDMQKATATLTNNKIPIGKNIQITNSENGLIQFLYNACGIS